MGFEINKFWTKKGFWRRRWIMSNHIHAVITSSNKSFKRFPAIWCLFNNTFISYLNVCKEMNSQYRNAASLALLCSFQCYSICHVHYDCTLASISRFKQIRFGYNHKINIFKFIIANKAQLISLKSEIWNIVKQLWKDFLNHGSSWQSLIWFQVSNFI